MPVVHNYPLPVIIRHILNIIFLLNNLYKEFIYILSNSIVLNSYRC